MKKPKKTMTQCGQKNSCESVDMNFHNTVWSNVTVESNTPGTTLEKCFGDPNPITTAVSSGLIAPSHDTKLLKRVVQYLTDASIILKANNNHFLADSATELVIQIKNQFGIS